MVYAAVLAGGIGKRMRRGDLPRFGDLSKRDDLPRFGDLPKQFLPLGNKCILSHTVGRFTVNPGIDKIFVIVPKEWVSYTENLFAGDDSLSTHADNIIVAPGGDDRNASLMAAVRKIEELRQTTPDDIIVSHDAVRPFVTQRIIDENIGGCGLCGAVGTVYAMTDTPMASDDGKTIAEIPARSRFYLAQTPQTFRIHLLKDVYASLTREERMNLTDACKMFVLKNKTVRLVMGESYNMKITTPFDYRMALALINEGAAPERPANQE